MAGIAYDERPQKKLTKKDKICTINRNEFIIKFTDTS